MAGAALTAAPAVERSAPSIGRAPLRFAIIVTVLVALGALFALSPVRDMVTDAAIPGARLARSPAYVALAPLSGTMDAVSLLSVGQSVVLWIWLVVLYVAWRAWRARAPRLGGRRGPEHDGAFGAGVEQRAPRRPARRELRAAALALLALVAFYVVDVLAPRPMAALRIDDPAVVLVDVHSHTTASHDGRPGFTAAANREWHREAGFDVAYITDHRSFAGADAGTRANPSRAGDGLVILSGIEVIRHFDHLLILGAGSSGWEAVGVNARPRGDTGGAAADSVVLVQTIPENLGKLPSPGSPDAVLAIELSDGAPRGIGQSQRERSLILHLADSLDLALVAASNNHGWGRTAAAWTALRIPGWRALTPDALGDSIQSRMRHQRRRATQVIERRSSDPGRSAVALALTPVAVVWNLARTISPAERVSWLVWTWGLVALGFLLGRRHAGGGAAVNRGAA